MISIITVVRNGVSTLEESILSVLNQNYKDFEYIIVDGVSTDGTLNVLNKYEGKIKFISEPDNGVYDAMNKGIALAQGNWIYFLGCDDILYSESTLSNVFSISNYDDYDVIYGNVLFKQSNKIFDGKFDDEKMVNRSICHQAIFYRREVFEKQGTFSTEYKSASDYIFNIKLYCLNSSKWLYIDKIIAIYNELGISQNIEKKYHDNSFAIRYDNFRLLNSKFILSKIFWSSFFRYYKTHEKKDSMKYLSLIFKDVGLLSLIVNLFVLIKKKYMHGS